LSTLFVSSSLALKGNYLTSGMCKVMVATKLLKFVVASPSKTIGVLLHKIKIK
jgi:hypothetical protein